MMGEFGMISLLSLCLLLGSSAAPSALFQFPSFAGEHGTGGGTSFSSSSELVRGPITGLRVRDDTSYIRGIQLQYGGTWGALYGQTSGTLHEILLRHGENITQVSGKFSTYINELMFVTNHGRIFRFGQPSGNSFNDFPLYEGTALRYISGRFSTALNSIGFHWGPQPK